MCLYESLVGRKGEGGPPGLHPIYPITTSTYPLPPLLFPFLHEQFDETSPRVPWIERKQFKKNARGPGGAQFFGAMFWGWRTGRRALGWPSTGVHVAASRGTNARRTEWEGGLYRGGYDTVLPVRHIIWMMQFLMCEGKLGWRYV